MEEKLDAYKELGYKVALHVDPFAISIVTPTMQRAHGLSEASQMAFVNSAVGCDRDNHCLTFVVSACAAAAVPLGLLITRTPADCQLAFNLFNAIVGVNSFGGRGYPLALLSGDVSTDLDELRQVYPESSVALGWTAVERAVWCWLWDDQHGIAVDDRRPIMQGFRRVMQCITVDEATALFNDCLYDGGLWNKYPSWQHCVVGHWARRQDWCCAWRPRNVHTDTSVDCLCDLTTRLYQDILSERCRTHAVLTLVDCVCSLLEDYIHSCPQQQPLFVLQHRLSKGSHIDKDSIVLVDDETLTVTNTELDGNASFCTVNYKLSCCTCEDSCGKFCQHLCAVWHKYESNYKLEMLAEEDLLLSVNDEPSEANGRVKSVCHRNESPTVEMIVENDSEESDEELFGRIVTRMTELHDCFGSSPSSIEPLFKRLAKINTAKQWSTFLLTHASGTNFV